MTQDEADKLVEAMFVWVYDSPIHSGDYAHLRLSTIANIVIDQGEPRTEISTAYFEAKKRRGL